MLTYFIIGLIVGMFIGGNIGVVLIAMMIAGRRGENRRDG